MAVGEPIRIITHSTVVCFIFFLQTLPASSSLNITSVLSAFPELSSFTNLISSTSIPSDLESRSSLTILAVPNSCISVEFTRRLSPYSLADLLRYHVLLRFISPSDLLKITASGSVVTTLLQTTGHANSNFGSVNITRDPATGNVFVRSLDPFSPSNASLLSSITSVPYNLSIYTVNSLLLPYGSDITASETRPTVALNITKALIDGHNFNVAASMLSASGIVEEFEEDEGGAGITLFVPTDTAFAELRASDSLQSLPADKKSVVLKYHVLHSYYPLGSLESVVNPFQPTLATEDMGAGSFTLNISRVNGSLAIDSGIVLGLVTQTVFDQNPVAIFGISRVLLPKEYFGSGEVLSTSASPPVSALSPEFSQVYTAGSPSRLSSPPTSTAELRAGASASVVQRLVGLYCIGVYLLV